MIDGRRRLLRLGLAGIALSGISRASGVAAQTGAPVGTQAGGSLEVHALDATIGKPAEGIAVELFLVSTAPAARVGQKTTNADGHAILIAGDSMKVGRYELRFAVGDYFRRRGVAQGTPPFLGIVPLRLYLGDPQRPYHIPFVFTPWGYTMHG